MANKHGSLSIDSDNLFPMRIYFLSLRSGCIPTTTFSIVS